MEKFTTNHSNLGIIHDGFKYRKEKETSKSVLWRCVEKNCKSRCKTDTDIQMILGGNFNHTYGEIDTRSVERQRIRQGCKRKATEEPSERPSKIINEIQKTNPAEILPQDITSVRQAIYRQRRKTQPKLPKSRVRNHRDFIRV